jgi:hypothetical protein
MARIGQKPIAEPASRSRGSRLSAPIGTCRAHVFGEEPRLLPGREVEINPDWFSGPILAASTRAAAAKFHSRDIGRAAR